MNPLITSGGDVATISLTVALLLVLAFYSRSKSKAGSLLASMSLCVAVLLILHQPTAEAQEEDDLRAKVQNPISSLISLPFKFNFDYGAPMAKPLF